MSKRVQVQLFPAFEGLSTFWTREGVAGVEESVKNTNKTNDYLVIYQMVRQLSVTILHAC